MHKTILLPFLVAGLASAAPTAPRYIRNAKRNPTRVQLEKRATCTFTTYAEVSASQSACTDIVLDGIAVPAGETLSLTDLIEGTTITFEGTTTFGYEEWTGPLIEVSGTSITVTAASSAVIDFGGESFWDGEGSNGGKTKPTAFYAHSLTDSTIEKLSVLNTPVQFMSVDNANSLDLLDITQNNAAGTTSGLAANTDGFDIASSTDVYISGAVITNQDDCVAINSGTSITFTGGTCTGGHGLSIGSVGGRDDNTVEDVLFESSEVIDSMNGVRIKTVYDATGSVTGCEYKDITLSGITEYGIVIEQDYENGSPTGTPTNGVTISGLIMDGITGTVESTAYDTYILCGDGSCTDWTWDDIDVTGGKTDADCENVPSGASCTG